MPSRARSWALLVLTISAAVLVMAGPAPVSGQQSDTPGRPTNLAGAVTHDAVTLTWDAPDDSTVTGYQILRLDRAVHALGDFQVHVEDTGSADTSYTDTDVEPEARYVYRVKARNGDTLGPQSNYFDADIPDSPPPPAAPSGLTGAVAHDQVALSWDAPEDTSVTGYQILRRNRDTDAPGDFDILVENTGTTDTTYTDTTVDAGARYAYRVKARNGDVLSAWSNYFNADVKTGPPPPAAPTGLTGAVAHNQVALSWTAPQGDTVTGYQILRRNRDTDAPADFAILVNDTGTTTTTYTDTTVDARARYAYRVKARNGDLLSALSQKFDADLPAGSSPLAAPTGLTGTVAHNQVALSWTAPQNHTVTGYQILRRSRDTDAPADFAILVNDTGTTTTAYTDTTVEAGARYAYRIKARNGDLLSGRSNPFNADVKIGPRPPAAPTGLTGAVAHNQVALSWTAPAADTITGYQILRHNRDTDASSDFAILVNDTGTTTTYTDTTVEAGTRYAYSVKARNGDLLSALSQSFDADVPQPPAVTVTFEATAYTVKEGASVTVRVVLDRDPERDMVIRIEPTNQDDASDDDYSVVPLDVTFGPGEIHHNVTFTATDDDDDDDGETVLLRFGADLPDRVSEGSANEVTVSITDNDGSTPEVVVSVDEDATRDGAVDLGDITEVTETQYPTYTINGNDDKVDYFRFTINVPRFVTMGIRQLDADASITIEDDAGEVIKSKAEAGAEHVMTYGTMLEGTYYVRVEATEAAENEYRLAYATREPNADRVVELREEATESQGTTEVVVSFEQSSYVVTEGQEVVVKVTLDVAPGESVTIPISPSSRNDTADSDYSGVPETVVFGEADLETIFTVTTTANDEIVDARGLTLSIGTGLPDNVTIGSNGTTTVFIAENVGPDSSVLISNIRKISSDSVATFGDNKWAIRFTTGSAGRAWRPTAIQLPITSWPEGTAPTVALHQAGTEDEPGELIAVLTNATAGSGIRTFTAPADITLESNTTYAIVLSSDGADASSAIKFGSTEDNGHDDGSADGWSLDDRSLQFSSNTWQARDARIRVTVLGTELSEWTGLEKWCSNFETSMRDPLYGCQWHLHNINVEVVWASGNLGEGINVAIVDDSLDYEHEDLKENVNTRRNYRYSGRAVRDLRKGHGTKVAGILAARDNDVGGRGVAPRATIYAYTNPVTSWQRAAAMRRYASDTAVSNNSWGFPSFGFLQTVSSAWERAVEDGVANGYGGKGVLYVWGAGNGGRSGDYANLSELTNHYAVVTVCGINYQDVRTAGSEMGPNLWICAPSADYDSSLPKITTASPRDSYTKGFSGTSAAAPIVSGVAALVRAANRDLTWRDVKLILAASARKNDATDDGWREGALKYGSTSDRYSFNYQYGFGAVDAGSAVALAEDWTNLPPFRTVSVTSDTSIDIPDALNHADVVPAVSSSVFLNGHVDFIEYVAVEVRMTHQWFRDLRMELESPSGAISTLTVPGRRDVPLFAFGVNLGKRVLRNETFRFGSAVHLGENASGKWTLRIKDEIFGRPGTLHSWKLTAYGHGHTPGSPSITSTTTGNESILWPGPRRTRSVGRELSATTCDTSEATQQTR